MILTMMTMILTMAMMAVMSLARKTTRMKAMSQSIPPPEPRSIVLLRRHNLLRPLVQREVVAAAVGGEELTSEDRQRARTTFLTRNRLTSEEALQGFLRDNALSPEDLEWQMELPLRIRQHCLSHFRGKAETRFLQRKNERRAG